MIKYHVRIFDVDEVILDSLRSDLEPYFDFEEVFEVNYMMNKNGKDVDILDFRCDEFYADDHDIHFSVAIPEKEIVRTIFISKCDYSSIEIW